MERKEYIMSKQMLRSGTSIGANITEGVYAQSEADFVSKMSIAQKEAHETEYWLELLCESGYITEEQYSSIAIEVKEVQKMLASTVMTMKAKLNALANKL